MNDVLAIILGGGQGSRLFPLTHQRSKPAVPIGGKYRLIDVPISNCLHADLRRIFVLTQFNSQSLNHHVSQTYRMDPFSHGFVDIIAAEQTPDSSSWFQGTADAVRQAARHFGRYAADYYLILAGDHLYRMDYGRMLDAHVDKDADITVAALPVTPHEAPGMGIFSFDREGQIVGFEEKPNSERLAAIGTSVPPGTLFRNQTYTDEKPFVASMGIYVFSREVLLDLLQNTTVTDFGREIIPAALTTHRVRAYLHDAYWADVGTIESFYDANIMLTEPDAPFRFYDPRRPTYTHERFLPPVADAFVHGAGIDRGGRMFPRRMYDRAVGHRHPHAHIPGHAHHALGAARSGQVCGRDADRDRTRCRARSRHHRQERIDR